MSEECYTHVASGVRRNIHKWRSCSCIAQAGNTLVTLNSKRIGGGHTEYKLRQCAVWRAAWWYPLVTVHSVTAYRLLSRHIMKVTAVQISLAFAWRNHKNICQERLSLGLRGFNPVRTRPFEGSVTKSSVSVGLSLSQAFRNTKEYYRLFHDVLSVTHVTVMVTATVCSNTTYSPGVYSSSVTRTALKILPQLNLNLFHSNVCASDPSNARN